MSVMFHKNYSTKTLFNVIKKYISESEIHHPTRHKYLIHLLRTDPKLSEIPKHIFDEEHSIQVKNYQNVKMAMFDWIKDKTIVKVYHYIYAAKWPGDPCYSNEYREMYEKVISATPDGVQIGKGDLLSFISPLLGERVEGDLAVSLYKPHVSSQRWYCGENFIMIEI